METTFKILHKSKTALKHKLLIVLGWEGMSLLFLDKPQRQIDSLIQYQFRRNKTAEDVADLIESLFEKEGIYFENIESCDVFFNFSESELIPSQFFKEDFSAEIISYLHGKENAAVLYNDPVKMLDAVNVYRVHEAVVNVLAKFFPAAVFHHCTTAEVDCLSQQAGKRLYCFVYNSFFKVLYFEGRQLMLVQYFSYNSPHDVAYHLLNICKQHQAAFSDVQLKLGGLIDENSMLFKDVSKFFEQVYLEPNPTGLKLSEQMQDHPEHFFSHLTLLTQCV